MIKGGGDVEYNCINADFSLAVLTFVMITFDNGFNL